MGLSKFKANSFTDAIKLYEHAGMVLTRAEKDGTNVNKVYLQLLNLYLLVNKMQEALNVLGLIEGRAEKQDNFKLLNEAANILRKYDAVDQALAVYKKAL